MAKRIGIIAGAVLGVVACCVLTWFLTNRAAQAEIESIAAERANIQARLDALGEPVTCYTVATQVEPGTQLKADLLVEMSVPSTWLTDDYCSLSDIIQEQVTTEDESGNKHIESGMYAKTYINPGTPITKSILMTDPIIDSTREIDVVANRWPIGLKVGDYVDIRVTYPMGEDFIVLSHKRVYEVNEQTLKLHMTEEEQHLYQAALVDYYVNLEDGMDIYFSKYIEPGVQDAATPYYSVPHNIAAVCLKDPNIVDAAMVQVKEDLLNMQNTYGSPFAAEGDQRPGFIRSGRDRLNSAVNSDYNSWKNDYDQAQEQQQQDAASSDEDGDSLLADGGVS